MLRYSHIISLILDLFYQAIVLSLNLIVHQIMQYNQYTITLFSILTSKLLILEGSRFNTNHVIRCKFKPQKYPPSIISVK